MIFHLANPLFLLLLLAAVIVFYYHWRTQRQYQAAIRFPSLYKIKVIKGSRRVKNRYWLTVLRFLTIVILITALARPQSGASFEEINTEGIDIMLVMDVSGSMKAEDFKSEENKEATNRLEVSKEVVKKFIEGRKGDRIGLVAFSRHSYTQCPLTLDYGVLLSFVERLHFGMIEDGTAIGMALSTAVNRLKDSKAKSKVIILLTDGRNNAGEVDPLTAAKVAKTFNLKIYAIGAGKEGGAPIPIDDPLFGRRYVVVPNDLDENTLRNIADTANGMYFRAQDEKGLVEIYKQIDEMEKTKVEVKQYTRFNELFPYLLFPALLLLLLEIFLKDTMFRTIP